MTEIEYAKKLHLYIAIAILVPAFMLLAGQSIIDPDHIKEVIYTWTIYRFFNIFWICYLFYFLIKIKKQRIALSIVYVLLTICVYNFFAYLYTIYVMLQNSKDLIDLRGLHFVLYELPLYAGRIMVVILSARLIKNTFEGTMKRVVQLMGVVYIIAILTGSLSLYFDIPTYLFLNDQYFLGQHLLNVISSLPLLFMIIMYVEELRQIYRIERLAS